MHFVVDKDTEIGERADASGTFQIACLSIEDPDRNSVHITKLVDQGKHFVSNDELKEYIQSGFCEVALTPERAAPPCPRDLTEPSRFHS